MKRKPLVTGILGAVTAAMLSVGTMTAFAAESNMDIPTGTGSYSYLAGQQRSVSRNELYAQAEMIEDEAEQKKFLVENGIADTEYSEEAAASYSYVGGRKRGAGYRSSDDAEQSEAKGSYNYTAGQQRGSSYRR